MGDTVDNPKLSMAPSLVRQSLLLALAVLVSFPFVAWFQHGKYGQLGLLATLVAAGVCFAAGMLALIVTDVFKGLGNPLAGLLASILVRTGLPLVAGVAIHANGGYLADSGTFGAILVFYLVTLTAETVIVARSMGRENSKVA